MLEELVTMWKELVANDEFFQAQAMGYKKLFDELVKQGFTEEQALQIISTKGIGFTGS